MPRIGSGVLSLWPIVTWVQVLPPLERKPMDRAMLMATLPKLCDLFFFYWPILCFKKIVFHGMVIKCHSKFEHCGQMALIGCNLWDQAVSITDLTS